MQQLRFRLARQNRAAVMYCAETASKRCSNKAEGPHHVGQHGYPVPDVNWDGVHCQGLRHPEAALAEPGRAHGEDRARQVARPVLAASVPEEAVPVQGLELLRSPRSRNRSHFLNCSQSSPRAQTHWPFIPRGNTRQREGDDWRCSFRVSSFLWLTCVAMVLHAAAAAAGQRT